MASKTPFTTALVRMRPAVVRLLSGCNRLGLVWPTKGPEWPTVFHGFSSDIVEWANKGPVWSVFL